MTRARSKPPVHAQGAIVRVGDGRGFVSEARRRRRIVVTAAHCLPHLPPPHPASYADERTFASLLGPVGEETSIWAECLFVDPVADLAVLGAPDSGDLGEESDAYEDFVDARPALSIVMPRDGARVWLLALDAGWHACSARLPAGVDRTIALVGEGAAWERGTSGSPILDDDGNAVGVVSVGAELNPVLVNCLPRWLARDLAGGSTEP